MIAGLTWGAIALGVSATLIAGFVRGLAGFGLAILLVPVLGLAIAPAEATVVGNWLGFLISFMNARQQISRTERSAWIIAGTALLAIPLGVFALGAMGAPIARLLIALIAVAAFIAVILPAKPHHVPGRSETLATGLATGLLAGFAGMPGPPVVPYYIRRGLDPATARASMLSIFFVTQGAGVVIAVIMGVANWHELWIALALYPLVVVGNWLGSKSFGRIDARAWRWIAGGVLGAAALGALFKLIHA
ncbi:MAG: sulfite exporter TauE/SafE family protein [Novosphingobium sp.]